jgi:hypothetical protein
MLSFGQGSNKMSDGNPELGFQIMKTWGECMNDFDPADIQDNLPEINEFEEFVEVPYQLEVLPDGREAVVIGNPEGCIEFNHQQGDNPYGYKGTCGLVSCEDVIRQFGIEVTEGEIVGYAIVNGLCNISSDPATSGGTTTSDQVQILNDYGIPAHSENMSDLESLAAKIEQGHAVIIGVNAGVVWNDPQYYESGQANHAVVVTGVARDPETGEIQGFFINDSGNNQSARLLDPATMEFGWLDAGGSCVVTDVVH